eukprot:NODE_348_length_10403_cov_0.608210.p1 type:complete len:1268 gc:universal NODE_348_length_10403_cov_0.608210:1396-5199(+)
MVMNKFVPSSHMRIFSSNEDKDIKSKKNFVPSKSATPLPIKTASFFEGENLSQLLISKNVAASKARLDLLCDINTCVDIFGNTPLHLAVSMKDIPFIILLLQKGSDIDACNNSGQTPWDLAIAMKDHNVLGLLLLFNNDINSIRTDHQNLLQQAENARGRFIYQKICLLNTIENSASLGHLEEVTIKLQNREVLESKDKNGVTILMRACYKGHLMMVRKIFEWGVLPEVKDKYGWNCLSYAVFGGHLDVIKYLIQNKKMAKVGDSSSNEPIVIAAYMGFYHIIVYFDETFDIFKVSKFVSKCVMMAVWMGHVTVIQYLKYRRFSSGEGNGWLLKGCTYVDKFYDHYSYMDGIKKNYKSEWIQQVEAIVNENNDLYAKRKVLVSYNVDESRLDSVSPNKPPCGNLIRLHFHSLPEIEEVRQKAHDIKLLVDVPEAYQPLILLASQRIYYIGTWLDEEYYRVVGKFRSTILNIDGEDKANVIVLSTQVKDVIEEVIGKIEKLINTLSQDKSGFLFLLNPTFLNLVKEASRKIDEDDLNELLKKTKLISGVWIPATAKKEFLTSLCTMMVDFGNLIDLINSTGIFNMYVLLFQKEVQKQNSNYTVNVTDVDYKDYKQKQYEQIQQDASKNEDMASDNDPDVLFGQRLEYLITQFVTSIKLLRVSLGSSIAVGDATNKKIENAGSAVHYACDAIVDEVIQYELFGNPDLVNKNDLSPALRNNIQDIRLNVLQHGQQVMLLANEMIKFAQLASGKWPPPDSKDALMYSLSPIASEIKELVEVSKQGATTIRQLEKLVMEKMSNWQKSVMQTQRLSKIFQFWDQNDAMQVQTESDYWDGTLEEKTIIGKDGLVMDLVVKGGRLTKFVEYLTHPLKKDEDFMADFFMTYRTFSAPVEVLDLLVMKYNSQPPFGLTEVQFMAFMKRHIAPMRLKIAGMFRYWVDKYFQEDFEQEESLLLKLKQFINQKISKDYAKHASEILSILKQLEGGYLPPVENAVSNLEIPKPLVTKKYNLSYIINDVRILLELDPVEVARQIVLVEYSLFYKIRGRETINQVYADTAGKEINLYPNVHRMISFTNQITMWVCSSMVSITDMKTRILMMKFFMSIAIALREIQNFNALTAIVAGLTMGPVYRLKKTLNRLEKSYPKVKEAYLESVTIVSPKGQYANYRKHLKTLQKPILPFLGVFITDMTFVDLGNNNFLPENHFINFDKRRKFSHLIKELNQYQRVPFNFVPISFIQEYLFTVKPEQNENKLFEMSQQVEPPEQQSDDDE